MPNARTTHQTWEPMQLFGKPPDEDARFWWEATGPILATMMQQANYRAYQQYHCLRFFQDCVAPALGPRPDRNGNLPWRSFMTDDHTPIELSWSWTANNENPVVRFAIEPIEKGTGGRSTCSDMTAIRKLVERIRPICPLLDLTWFESLAQSLTVPGDANSHARAGSRAPLPSTTEHNSQYFAAFDLAPSGITFKAYFLPQQRALREGTSPWELVHAAVQTIATPHPLMASALDRLVRYNRACLRGHAVEVEIVSVDCVPVSLTRLKIYIRSRATSFNSVRQIMRLGEADRPAQMETAMRKLRTLWELVLGLAPGWSDDDELDLSGHRTAGILYYLEFRPNAEGPVPKLYIPVRHYAQNDLQIAAGLAAYLGNTTENGYLDMLRETFRHKRLECSLGLHTYITAAIKGSNLAVTSYLNPQIYAPGEANSMHTSQRV